MRAFQIEMSSDIGAILRIAIFFGLLILFATAERFWPRRANPLRAMRWPTNIGLSLVNTALLRLVLALVPGAAVLAAYLGDDQGLLAAVGLSGLGACVVGFLLLDLAVYAQHRLFHIVPVLWRVHRVHHADFEFDVTTGIRFHPIEMVISQCWKIAVVLIAGVPVISVLVFEIVLNASSMFSHSNLRLPEPVDRVLRLFIVTPEMHRVHHSIEESEMNTNYGFNFSLWDRLFGSYLQATHLDQAVMPIGLPEWRTPKVLTFGWSLRFPFVSGPSA